MTQRWTIEQKTQLGPGAYTYQNVEVVLASDYDQLRGELSLAEEGLANYQQEIEQLKAERDQWKKRADELFFAEHVCQVGLTP